MEKYTMRESKKVAHTDNIGGLSLMAYFSGGANDLSKYILNLNIRGRCYIGVITSGAAGKWHRIDNIGGVLLMALY